MSRRNIIGKDPAHDIVVGWDPPLVTFFVIVTAQSAMPGGEDDDDVILWLGTEPKDGLNTVEDLARVTEPYAVIDDATRVQLAADRAINDGQGPNEVADRLAEFTLKRCGNDHAKAIQALMDVRRTTPRTGSVMDQLQDQFG